MTRGLVMYESLLKTCDDFHLYVFAFDDNSYHFLKVGNYAFMTIISLQEFEDPDLLAIKSQRSAAEYCWTSTPSTIQYAIEKYKLANCTYIDADLYFYSNPGILIEEMGDKSVMITEHRYTKEYDRSEISGKYCVQFMTFKADETGLKVLNWWRERCLEWCFARPENGKFGDQKYLDDWSVRFNGIYELSNLGGGVAPWNIQQYEFRQSDQGIIGTEKKTGAKFTTVFFHFHGLKFYQNDIVNLPYYRSSKQVFELFYKPYINLLKENQIKIMSNNSFDPNGTAGRSVAQPMNFLLLVKFLLASLIYGFSFKKTISEYHYYKINQNGKLN